MSVILLESLNIAEILCGTRQWINKRMKKEIGVYRVDRAFLSFDPKAYWLWRSVWEGLLNEPVTPLTPKLESRIGSQKSWVDGPWVLKAPAAKAEQGHAETGSQLCEQPLCARHCPRGTQ